MHRATTGAKWILPPASKFLQGLRLRVRFRLRHRATPYTRGAEVVAFFRQPPETEFRTAEFRHSRAAGTEHCHRQNGAPVPVTIGSASFRRQDAELRAPLPTGWPPLRRIRAGGGDRYRTDRAGWRAPPGRNTAACSMRRPWPQPPCAIAISAKDGPSSLRERQSSAALGARIAVNRGQPSWPPTSAKAVGSAGSHFRIVPCSPE